MKKKHNGPQIVAKSGQADILISHGKTVPEGCKEIDVSGIYVDQTGCVFISGGTKLRQEERQRHAEIVWRKAPKLGFCLRSTVLVKAFAKVAGELVFSR